MWITQTYLGEVEPAADVFVYYFFEDYDSTQIKLTKRIQSELEGLGELFGSKVSLFMPNSRYAIRIESELREKFQSLWWDFQGKLPGLFVCTAPLQKLDLTSGEGHFFSLAGATPAQVSRLAARIRQISDERLMWKHDEASTKAPKKSTFRRFVDALEVKPGIVGIRIDLKKFAGL